MGDEPGTKILVGNISDAVDTEIIERVFQKFGTITELDFDVATAFITYEKAEEAFEAIEIMDGKELRGERLRVDMYREGKSPPPPAQIYEDRRGLGAARSPSPDPRNTRNGSGNMNE